MAESVEWSYDGAATVTATVSDAVVDSGYRLSANDPESNADTETAVSSTLVLTIDDVGGLSPDDPFTALVDTDPGADEIATHDFVFGTPDVPATDAVLVISTATGLVPGSFTERARI